MESGKHQRGEPVRIEYYKMIEHEGYLTGIAPYRDPFGRGEFNLHVSGSAAALENYQRHATITELAMVPI